MLDTRYLKLLRDLGQHRARSLLVVAAVAIGLTGAGAILNTWALTQRATELGYRSSLPASATLSVDRVDAALLQQLRAMPELAAVRARLAVRAAVQSGGGWRNAMLYAVDDFADPGLGRLHPDSGSWPPRDGEWLIERSSLEFSGASVGEPALLKLGQGEAQPLALGGVVRDVSLAPGWMEHLVYGYATPATLARLGAPAAFNELQFRVRDAAPDRAAVRRIAAAVKTVIERSGARVTAVDVPEPGQHIHAAQMDSLLMTQGAFGLLALLVCAFLVVNLINAMLAGQSREIGILKVLGAGPRQIMALYLSQALLLGVAASLIALPAAIAIGRQYAGFKADLLNFPIAGHAIPWWAIALQLPVGCLLPVAAAALPVRRACRISVGAALRDIGIVTSGQALATTRRWPVGGLSRPLLMAIGNAFRRRQRMVLTLLALAVGGAVYLGAANLRGAVSASVDLLYADQRHDVSLRLAEPQPAAALEAAALAVDGIAAAEAWRGQRATRVQADGLDDGFAVLGLPPASVMLRPRLLAGRWLTENDRMGLVVNGAWLKQHRELAVGAELALTMDGRRQTWRIVGSVDAGLQPLAYAARAAVGGEALATSLVVRTGSRSAAAQLDAIQRLRAALAEAGMPVASSQLQSEGRRIVEDHLLMVVDFLGAMAWVMIVVGGMGLASTMGMGVLERTREIGVLRAIGAPGRTIQLLVQTEGLVIVVLAWALSLPLSATMSLLLAEAFGRIMFAVPAQVIPSAATALGWLAIMLLVSLLACAWPARNASRISAAQALSYE
ncbi:FtsX-like permease family protein [Roseateles toxinivorans]|uniref:Putative ABC transport system permease protein n=1 Tax=Roseateles toxinivorans TaxID=270368 RepID=A0A4R6QRA9_9BURK|nr:FtsX-like permease family protein [Roseateles toxinivorans]TDP72725.1 putative ABC transport system permease protein [Roseateles toxinivorans]